MCRFDIRRYDSSMADEWNAFVAKSKNGTFLFDRRYMDYHADRFADHSFMIYHKGRLFALLPATIRTESGIAMLSSHAGLSYGGLVTNRQATAENVCLLFEELNDRLREEGIRRVIYRPTPHIYHRLPSEEDLYALLLTCKATIISRDVSSVIRHDQRIPFTESRRSGIRKAFRNGITANESRDFPAFWNVLTDNLLHTYGAKPVHTLDEIQMLADHFPDNIRLFTACHEGHVVGGTVVYQSEQVARIQYISASPEGKSMGALDLLFDHLVNTVYATMPYIDFGTSTRTDNAQLNKQLIFQKEGFGGRAVCYDTYEWEIGV